MLVGGLSTFGTVQRGGAQISRHCTKCNNGQCTNFVLLCRIQYCVDAAYCCRRGSVVCLSVTIMSPAKATEPISMTFGMSTGVGPWNHVLHGGRDPHV